MADAADLIREAIDPDAEIIFGTTINEDLHDEVDSDDTKQRDQYDREMEYDEMEY